MTWQPIATAPRDGTEILAIDNFGQIAVVSYDADLALVNAPSCWAWRNGFSTDAHDSVLWMPLPPPPEAAP